MKKKAPHHVQYAHWSAFQLNGDSCLRADFSDHLEVKNGKPFNPHYEGAKTNIQRFGEYRRGEHTALDMSKVVFDDERSHIEIIGGPNTKTFINWESHNCPELIESFIQHGIFLEQSLKALHRDNEIEVQVVTRHKSASVKPPPQQGKLFNISPEDNGFDPQERLRVRAVKPKPRNLIRSRASIPSSDGHER